MVWQGFRSSSCRSPAVPGQIRPCCWEARTGRLGTSMGPGVSHLGRSRATSASNRLRPRKPKSGRQASRDKTPVFRGDGKAASPRTVQKSLSREGDVPSVPAGHLIYCGAWDLAAEADTRRGRGENYPYATTTRSFRRLQDSWRFFWLLLPQGVNIRGWSPPEKPAMERRPMGVHAFPAFKDAETLIGTDAEAVQPTAHEASPRTSRW